MKNVQRGRILPRPRVDTQNRMISFSRRVILFTRADFLSDAERFVQATSGREPFVCCVNKSIAVCTLRVWVTVEKKKKERKRVNLNIGQTTITRNRLAGGGTNVSINTARWRKAFFSDQTKARIITDKAKSNLVSSSGDRKQDRSRRFEENQRPFRRPAKFPFR